MTVEANSLSPKQAFLMWCLLGHHGETPQSAILPKVRKADREALVRKGYIRSEKKGRGFLLSVEDKGWHWAGDHLDAILPPNLQALRNWLMLISQHLKENNGTLAEFVGPKPVVNVREEVAPRKGLRRKKAQKTRAATPLSHAQLRQRIEAAYLVVTGGKKAEKAMLDKLREQLSDLDRSTVDAGLLRILQGDDKARLGQMNSPKELSGDERQAAFNPAGEPFHYLWIQT